MDNEDWAQNRENGTGHTNTQHPTPNTSVITAIEEQKRRGNRRSIYVDGEFFAGVDEEVVIALRLKVGQKINTERLAEVVRTEELRKAREAALTLLDYRARTAKELEKRLIQKGYPEDVVHQVVSQLENINFVDDEKFARDWVAGRLSNRPTGKSQMQWELRRKGVSEEIAEEAVEQVDEEKEFEMALEFARKKLGIKPLDQDMKRKLAGSLQRRGFHWETVSRVLNRIAPEDD